MTKNFYLNIKDIDRRFWRQVNLEKRIYESNQKKLKLSPDITLIKETE